MGHFSLIPNNTNLKAIAIDKQSMIEFLFNPLFRNNYDWKYNENLEGYMDLLEPFLNVNYIYIYIYNQDKILNCFVKVS